MGYSITESMVFHPGKNKQKQKTMKQKKQNRVSYDTERLKAIEALKKGKKKDKNFQIACIKNEIIIHWQNTLELRKKWTVRKS